jgi:mannitol-1-phosphate/altronate dehydrogenase
LDYCQDRLNSSSASSNNHGFELSYEVDTVQFDGQIQTNAIPCYGAGTLGTKEGKDEVMQKLLVNMKNLSVIGIGVTEAGLTSSTTKAVQDLADILKMCHRLMTMKGNNGKSKSALQCSNPNGRICIICTDNVPNSGDLLKRYMLEIASANQEINDASSFQIFLKQKVTFHNTMVDRITSQRDGSNGMVPRAEPVPAKALVIEDLHGDLPPSFCNDEMKTKYGVVVRTNKGQLADDIALKLRVANGTHTAVAHLMALNKLLLTDALSSGSHASILIMAFLDSFFEQQILPAAQESFGVEETKAVYDDWRSRLVHAHFGLSTFFITQNGAAKGGIRIGPTIRDLIAQDKVQCSVKMYFQFFIDHFCLIVFTLIVSYCITAGHVYYSIYSGVYFEIFDTN